MAQPFLFDPEADKDDWAMNWVRAFATFHRIEIDITECSEPLRRNLGSNRDAIERGKAAIAELEVMDRAEVRAL